MKFQNIQIGKPYIIKISEPKMEKNIITWEANV